MLEKRPIVTILVGYLIGIIIGLYFKESRALLFTILAIVFIIYLTAKPTKRDFKLISIKRYGRYLKIIFTKKVILIIAITAIISNIIVINQNKRFNQIYKTLTEKSEITITAKVKSNKQERQYRNVYKVKYKSWYFLINVPKSLKNLKYGEAIKINGTYIEPESRRNYKSFDYKNYLKTLKIAGTIKVENVEEDTLNENIFEKIITKINTIANDIFLKIKQTVEKDFNNENANILLGIILGHTENIEDDVKEKFSKSNLSHVLAASGMHVSYLIFSINFLLKKVLGKKYCRIVSIIVIILYMLVTGCKPSIVRTVIMTSVLLIGNLIYRKSDVWQNISLAALVLLIYNPFLITNSSAMLSFAGTFAIILMQEYIGKSYIKLSLAVSIIIIPIMAILYNQIAFSSIAISTFIVFLIAPLMILSLIYLVITLVKIPMISDIFIKSITLILELIKEVIDFGSNLPLAKIYVISPNFLQIVLYYFIIFISIFLYKIYHTKRKNSSIRRVKNLVNLAKYRFKQNQKKYISCILIVIITLVSLKFIPKDLRIYFVDVGQGDCTLILTSKNKSILIDGGEQSQISYLLDRGVKTLDYIIISHFDSDHFRRN